MPGMRVTYSKRPPRSRPSGVVSLSSLAWRRAVQNGREPRPAWTRPITSAVDRRSSPGAQKRAERATPSPPLAAALGCIEMRASGFGNGRQAARQSSSDMVSEPFTSRQAGTLAGGVKARRIGWRNAPPSALLVLLTTAAVVETEVPNLVAGYALVVDGHRLRLGRWHRYRGSDFPARTSRGHYRLRSRDALQDPAMQ
jgi:hypothetical protein